MKRLILAFTLSNIALNLYAGTPSATDSTVAPVKPTYYMTKFLSNDRANVTNIVVTQINSGTNSCGTRDVVSPLSNSTIHNVKYFQIGMFGEVAEKTRLYTDNYHDWAGSSVFNVTAYYCNGVCNYPYWVYDYTALQIICAPVYSDWVQVPL